MNHLEVLTKLAGKLRQGDPAKCILESLDELGAPARPQTLDLDQATRLLPKAERKAAGDALKQQITTERIQQKVNQPHLGKRPGKTKDLGKER